MFQKFLIVKSPILGALSLTVLLHVIIWMAVILPESQNYNVWCVLRKIPLLYSTQIRVIFNFVVTGFYTEIIRSMKPACSVFLLGGGGGASTDAP